jgi:hypothetical protein
MFWWLPRRRARIKRLDAEAEALICELGVDAYAEARRKEYEASSDIIAKDWGRQWWSPNAPVWMLCTQGRGTPTSGLETNLLLRRSFDQIPNPVRSTA